MLMEIGAKPQIIVPYANPMRMGALAESQVRIEDLDRAQIDAYWVLRMAGLDRDMSRLRDPERRVRGCIEHRIWLEETYNKGIDKELDQEDVAVGLGRQGKGAKNGTGSSRRIEGYFHGHRYLFECCNFLVVLAHEDQGSHKSTKDLSKNIIGNLLEGKALPDSKGNRDGRVEVATTGRGTTEEKLALSEDRSTGNTNIVIAKQIPIAYAQPIWKMDPNYSIISLEECIQGNEAFHTAGLASLTK